MLCVLSMAGDHLCYRLAVFAVSLNFAVEHALSCPHGGLPYIRHNELRDITVGLLSEVCHNVALSHPCSL